MRPFPVALSLAGFALSSSVAEPQTFSLYESNPWHVLSSPSSPSSRKSMMSLSDYYFCGARVGRAPGDIRSILCYDLGENIFAVHNPITDLCRILPLDYNSDDSTYYVTDEYMVSPCRDGVLGFVRSAWNPLHVLEGFGLYLSSDSFY